MALEIERKFLVDVARWSPPPDPFESRVDYITQGYLSKDADRTVRVRVVSGAQRRSVASMTVKSRTIGITRTEIEFEIPYRDARDLLGLCILPVLNKKRYHIDYAGKTWEVDVFSQPHDGLVLAEIELGSEDETFELPPWIDREVSGEPAYFNSSLAAAAA